MTEKWILDLSHAKAAKVSIAHTDIDCTLVIPDLPDGTYLDVRSVRVAGDIKIREQTGEKVLIRVRDVSVEGSVIDNSNGALTEIGPIHE